MFSYLISLASLALVVIADPSAGGASQAKFPYLTQVSNTDGTYEKFLKDNQFSILVFYSPSCGACVNMQQPLQDAIKMCEEAPASNPCKVAFAGVNANGNDDLFKAEQIMHYPTLKYCRDGVCHGEYKGGHSAQNIYEFATYFSKDTLPLFENLDAIPTEANMTVKVVYQGPENAELQKVIYRFCIENSAYMYCAGVITPEVNTLTLFRNDEAAVEFPVPATEDVIALLTKNQYPIFGPVNRSNLSMYTAKPNSHIFWVAAVTTEYEQIRPSVEKACAQRYESVSCVWVDADVFKTHLTMLMGSDKTPAAVLMTDKGRFGFPGTFDSEDDFNRFIDSALAGNEPQLLMSQSAPESNDSPVKVVVATTFKDMVFSNSEDSLLLVHAEWCGHCRAIEPVYTLLGEAYDSDSVRILKIDGEKNESPIPDLKWTAFPTIMFFKANTEQPIKYEGDRTLDDLKSFIERTRTQPGTSTGAAVDADIADVHSEEL